jgi:hypothetical protein
VFFGGPRFSGAYATLVLGSLDPRSLCSSQVTVRPTQKVGLLLKAWLADNEVDAADAPSYSLVVGSRAVEADDEIGQVSICCFCVRVGRETCRPVRL